MELLKSPELLELRALVVSYGFPPVGGAGVQRVVKLVKYLPGHNVRPAVLTVANPSVPVHDESLSRDLPKEVEIVRARTLEPSYRAKNVAWRAHARRDTAGACLTRIAMAIAKQVLFPDPQVLWQPCAQRALARRIASRRDDVVLVSGPPFSQFLLAPLARAAGLGVVLDYRDEWSTVRSTYEMGGSRISRALGAPLEAVLLRAAHGVVTAPDEFRERVLDRFPFLDPATVVTIPNGYDPDDFPPELPSPPADRFVLTYAGTVFTLTSARGLLAAIQRLHARCPELGRLLKVRFLGRIVQTELDAFEGSEALGVDRVGYVPHAQVLHELAASHSTLCLLDDVPGAERIYPAKIFELMRLGRPVLTLAPPDSALARLVTRHELGPLAHPRDTEAIANQLQSMLSAFRSGDKTAGSWRKAPGIERYDRQALAGQFAEILRDAASRGRRRGS